jgi:hypothetical protein
MKVRWILLALLVLGVTSEVQAGGPPPMYVTVDKVVLEPGVKSPRWVQIWGCITRSERSVDSTGQARDKFSQPTYGYLFLSLPSNEQNKVQTELEDWKKAAGAGKAVAVGICGEAGSFLKCAIHQPPEKASEPDASYTPGQLKLFGSLYADDALAKRPEVKALLKFASEHK